MGVFEIGQRFGGTVLSRARTALAARLSRLSRYLRVQRTTLCTLNRQKYLVPKCSLSSDDKQAGSKSRNLIEKGVKRV